MSSLPNVRTLADYRPYLRGLELGFRHRTLFAPAAVPRLREALSRHPKLVCVVQHGAVSAPPLVLLSLYRCLLEHGGEALSPRVVAWRGFYDAPFVRQLMPFVSQLTRAPNADELVRVLDESARGLLVVMPEGEHAAFSDGRVVAPFLSARFVEIAVRCAVPILIVAHAGSEATTRSVRVSGSVSRRLGGLHRRLSALEHTGVIGLPRWARRTQLTLAVDLYEPRLTSADLTVDARTRERLVWQEAGVVYQRLCALRAQLAR